MALSRPRSDRVGPRASPSPVWFSTTSTMTSNPAVLKRGHGLADFLPAARREARIGRHQRDRIVAPVIGEPGRRTDGASSIQAAQGMISTVVTPSFARCSSTAGAGQTGESSADIRGRVGKRSW